MIRRVVLVASMVTLLWAAPASAQTYAAVESVNQGQVVISSNGPAVQSGSGNQVSSAGAGNGDFARTGSSNVTPLVQVGFVLLGGGALLVSVARRRRTARRT